MKFLNEGETVEIKGSGKKPYIVKKSGGVVSCSCPAWRNLGGGIDTRICKHIKANIDPACLLPQALEKNEEQSSAIGGAVTKETAPPVLLAHSFSDEDPDGWWMTEKLDGVRAWWDGENFISRLGNTYMAPQWFRDAMPKGIVLDGELFLGRKRFQETISIVRKHVPDDKEWEQIRYCVFDAPKAPGTYEERYAYLDQLNLRKIAPYWEILPKRICNGLSHLMDELKEIEKLGGEGVMLRAPKSMYEEGRSSTLLKVKSFFDAEATVIGTKPGKGKHKGRMGALCCKSDDGKEFDVGSGFTDKQREMEWKNGTRITYRYQELTKDGAPRFPTFVSARDYE